MWLPSANNLLKPILLTATTTQAQLRKLQDGKGDGSRHFNTQPLPHAKLFNIPAEIFHLNSCSKKNLVRKAD